MPARLAGPRLSPGARPERADRPDADAGLLDRAFDTLARTARLSGAYRTVVRALERSLERAPPADGQVSVLDVGAGRGDLLRHLAARLARDGTVVRALGGDPHPVALTLCRARNRSQAAGGDPTRPAQGAVIPVRLTASALPLAPGSVDFVVSTVTFHHLEGEEAAAFLSEADRVARRGWIVVDLRRSAATYALLRLLAATVWRSNPLPRHDGPISARRSFRLAEVRELLRRAGLDEARATRSPPLHVTIRGGELAPGGRR